jgi:hypothetical protein
MTTISTIAIASRRTGIIGRALLMLVMITVAALLVAGQAHAEFGLVPGSFEAGAHNEDGSDYTQAGGHPYSAATSFEFNSTTVPQFGISPDGRGPHDLTVDLPPGFLGNPQAAEECPIALLGGLFSSCPSSSRVGTVDLTWVTLGLPNPEFGVRDTAVVAVYNVAPPRGNVALLGFDFLQHEVLLFASVHSSGDYGVRILSPGINVGIRFLGARVTLYSDPGTVFGTGPSERPFLTNPTNCSEEQPVTKLSADSWDDMGDFLNYEVASPKLTGCDQLQFHPSITVTPESTTADQPTGLSVDLTIPQVEEFDKPATPALRNAVVTLPQGISVNPSLAEGLQGCTDAQWSEHDGQPGACPLSSKIGSLEVTTPLLDHKLPGNLYVRQPDPGASRTNGLYTLFLEVNDPISGVIVKLRGSVVPDEKTGQLTATFTDNPQLPFEKLHLQFKGGPNGALVNRGGCGTYTTQAELTPWAGPNSTAATPTSSFTVDGCGAGGFQPGFEAGSADTGAGHYSPFALRVTRKDGEQNLSSIDATLPVGLTAKLAGVPLCGDAEAATGNCPGASQIGSVIAAVGSGSNPLYVPQPDKTPTGVYLAGPYKGAPYSLVVKVPAQAGPFDLGTVAVRSAISIDAETAQVSVKSDPLPQILEGVPIAYRDLQVKVDRPNFTLNPTSCNKMSVRGRIGSSTGGGVDVSSPFQVGNCGALGFGPQLAIQLKGATGRLGHPALTAVLAAGPGEANIARAQVNLPHGEFLDQGNLNKTCTKPVLLAGACPESSVYGYAKAWTPLLDKPLEGPVYLVGGYGFKLPALVAELNGQIKVLLVGKVDSGSNKGIRNTFEMVPDAPVSRFELQMKGGKKYGLLENSEDLCKASKQQRQANVYLNGQNGKVDQFKPVVANQCGKAGAKKSGKKHK